MEYGVIHKPISLSSTLDLTLVVIGGASLTVYVLCAVIFNRNADENDDLESQIMRPPTVSERTALRPSLRVAAHMYNAYGSYDHTQRTRSAAPSDGMITPLSSVPSTPSSVHSYFGFSREPLYVSDVSHMLDRERRYSSSKAPSTYSNYTPPETPGSSIHAKSRSLLPKSLANDTSCLLTSLLCLLHSKDLNDFFLSGEYQFEDLQNDYKAIIESYASVARHFHSSRNGTPPTLSLDLSVFQSLLASDENSQRSTFTLNDHNAKIIKTLLRSLHVALNDGEYTAEQPTYLRTHLVFDGQPDVSEIRDHVGHMKNMGDIQEDSLVKDLFEGVICHTSRCFACDETIVSFESFSILQLPRPESPDTSTLSDLLVEYEKPIHPSSDTARYCVSCNTLRPCIEYRSIWSLPTTLILQLTPPSLSPQSNHTAYTQYPLQGLDMSRHDVELSSVATPESASYGDEGVGPSSYFSSNTDLDKEMSTYDLFAVRERVISPPSTGSIRPFRYRAYAKDPSSDGWNIFDGETVSEVKQLQDVQTPHADLLFYRRRL
ncbi:ubiquitin-specific protease doa4 [Tulasnella sp. 418]|nr:ubiquitin-specific protease doa4 [Tulasnella sp. 418]